MRLQGMNLHFDILGQSLRSISDQEALFLNHDVGCYREINARSSMFMNVANKGSLITLRKDHIKQ